MVTKVYKMKTECGCNSLMVTYEKGEKGLKATGVCPNCGHVEFEGEYAVGCPYCGHDTVPEVDEAGTRYPCCGTEVPGVPRPEWLKPIKEVEMVKEIVTHTRPGHSDDILAVALLTQKYPEAEVRFIHPQDKELETLKERDDVILVDVGGDYNPEKKNYDHHQDLDFSCSLVLVLQNEFPEYRKVLDKDTLLRKSLELVDFKDRFGPKKAQEITGIDPTGAYLFEEMVVKTLGETPEGLRTLGKALRKALDEKLSLINDLERIKVYEVNGYKVAVDEKGINAGLITQNLDVDLIVQRNTRNPEHTSVIKNTQGKRAGEIDLFTLSDSAVFVHKAGFIAVLPVPVEDVNVEEVVERVTGESPDRGIERQRRPVAP